MKTNHTSPTRFRAQAVALLLLAVLGPVTAAAATPASAPRLAGEYLADFAPDGEIVPPMWAAFTAEGAFLMVGMAGTYTATAGGDINIKVQDSPEMKGKLVFGAEKVTLTGSVGGETMVQKYHKPSACRAGKKQLQGGWEYALKELHGDLGAERKPDVIVKDDTLLFSWRGENLKCSLAEAANGKPSTATDRAQGRVFEVYMLNDTLVLWERSADRKVRKEWGFVRLNAGQPK